MQKENIIMKGGMMQVHIKKGRDDAGARYSRKG